MLGLTFDSAVVPFSPNRLAAFPERKAPTEEIHRLRRLPPICDMSTTGRERNPWSSFRKER